MISTREKDAKKLASRLVSEWPGEHTFDANEILTRHPQLQEHKSIVLDLAFEEYTQRLERGERVAPSTFANQFSTFQKSLVELLEVNAYLHAHDIVPQDLDGITAIDAGQSMMGYDLLEEIGEGSFSRVFLARQPQLGDREVVVKLYCGGHEADTLGQLQHPYITPVYSVEHNHELDLSVLCMPYLGRTTLLDVLDVVYRNPAGSNDAATFDHAISESSHAAESNWNEQYQSYVDAIAEVGLQMAEALAYTHRKGWCHGDIKPSNVLVLHDGECRLFDFNLSFASDSPLLNLGGTLPYMAPEQLEWLIATDNKSTATDPVETNSNEPESVGSETQPPRAQHSRAQHSRAQHSTTRQPAAQQSTTPPRQSTTQPSGDACQADPRSDLFAWGVTMYELLAGRHPFGNVSRQADRQTVAEAILRRQRTGVVDLRKLNPHVNSALAGVIHRCLEYDAENRSCDAEEIVRQLLSRKRPLRRGLRHFRHHPWQAATAVALLVVIAVLTWASIPTAAEKNRRAAESWLAEHRYEESLNSCNRAIELDGTNPELFYLHGRILLQLERFSDARDSFQDAIELEPSGELAAWIGYELSLAKDFQAAIRYYELAVNQNVHSRQLYHNLGFSCLQYGDLAQAEKYLMTVLQASPDSVESWSLMVRLELRLAFRGKRAPDLRILDQAVAAGADSGEFLFDRACTLSLMARSAVDAEQKSDYLNEALAVASLAVQKDFPPQRLATMASCCPELRKNPRFQRLLAQPVKLAAARPTRIFPPLANRPFD